MRLGRCNYYHFLQTVIIFHIRSKKLRKICYDKTNIKIILHEFEIKSSFINQISRKIQLLFN